MAKGNAWFWEREKSVPTDAGQSGAITPVPRLPNGSAIIDELVEDLLPFYDDGSENMQHMIARVPLLLEVQRAYVGRISADGKRFTITQASGGDWPELLGYTQSVSRLPAFVRGSLKSGVQGYIEDAATFPFTPQQRKMLCYAGIGATVFTPIPTAGGVAGALIVDQLATQRPWDTWTLDSCKLLAEAIGARIALAKNGDHFAVEDVPASREATRVNVLSNLAHMLEHPSDPDATTAAFVSLLEGLPWVGAVRAVAIDGTSHVIRDALAHESILIRKIGTKSIVGIPLMYEGQKFGGLEVMLVERMTDLDEQFWRTVKTFAGSAYAGAVRRGRPRDETLTDGLTGLGNYRAINESLAEAVHAAKSSGRPVSAWFVDIDGLDAINRTHGFATGDDVVSYVGNTLGMTVSSRGMVGRVGAGMFLAFFPQMDTDETHVQARMTVERIVKNAPNHLPPLTLTVGVAVYPAQATGYDDLVRSARLALFVAKGRGANTVEVSRVKDDAWMRDARAAFVRISTEQLMPAALTPIRK